MTHHCQGCPGKGRKHDEEPCCRCDDPPYQNTGGINHAITDRRSENTAPQEQKARLEKLVQAHEGQVPRCNSQGKASGMARSVAKATDAELTGRLPITPQELAAQRYPDHIDEWAAEAKMERLHGPNWDRHLSHDEEETP